MSCSPPERPLAGIAPAAWLNLHIAVSVADAETMQVRLLAAAEAVLGFDLLSGMATQYLT